MPQMTKVFKDTFEDAIKLAARKKGANIIVKHQKNEEITLDMFYGANNKFLGFKLVNCLNESHYWLSSN